MRHPKRLILQSLVMLVVVGSMSYAQAQADTNFPTRPITLIIPFPPGGPTDVTGRLLAEKLSPILGQPVVIDNRAGASGNIGAVAAARAAPDGYTLFFATGGTHGANPALYKNPGYDAVNDFAPVAWVTISPNIVVVNPDFPAKTMKELVDLARANPDKYSSAAAGTGSTPHMAGELFKRVAGVKIVHVPYKGSAPALSDVIAGHVPIMFDGIPSSLPLIKSGRLRALAVTSAERAASLPDVPTVAELFPGFEASGWFAVFAPAQTPPAVIARLNQEIIRVLKQPEVQMRFADLGAMTVGGPPDKLRNHVAQELKKWSDLVKETGIRVE